VRAVDEDAHAEARRLRLLERPHLAVAHAEVLGLHAAHARVGPLRAERRGEIHGAAGESFNIDSPKQLQRVLFEKLKLSSGKRTKTGFSTDVSVLEKLAEEHALPAKILEYRQLAKLKGTYVDALPEMIHPETGRVHTSYNQAIAATGRLSSSDPNLQNIPIRTEEGRLIRTAFKPEDGCEYVSADYSQIELRVLAHLTDDPVLVQTFTNGEDIHTRTAAEVFDVLPGLVTGGQPSAQHLTALKRAGCEVVLDIRDPMEPRPFRTPEDVRAAGLEYVNVPVGHGAVPHENQAHRPSS